MRAEDAFFEVSEAVRGLPVFMAGSLPTAVTYGKANAYDDADIFCPNIETLMLTGAALIGAGWAPEARHARVWERWVKRGVDEWHTNSLKLEKANHTTVNIVFKTDRGQRYRTLAEVLESFDYGLLGTGYEAETGTWRDLRPYLFPELEQALKHSEHYRNVTPLPLMPLRREDWRSGFISEYQSLREFGRYEKYARYGYDMSAVKDDLITGYSQLLVYLIERGDPEKLERADMLELVIEHIANDELDKLGAAAKLVPTKSPLDVIMDALR